MDRANVHVGAQEFCLIVRDAFLGKRRFSEFQKSLGLAKNILCVRLRKLVSYGVLTTGPASAGSTYDEYRLTEKGRSLYLVLVALRQWEERYLFDKGELDLSLVDWETGQPIKPLELRSQDGRLLGPVDLRTISNADPGAIRLPCCSRLGCGDRSPHVEAKKNNILFMNRPALCVYLMGDPPGGPIGDAAQPEHAKLASNLGRRD